MIKAIMTTIWKIGLYVIFSIAVAMLLLSVIEGIASFIFIIQVLRDSKSVAERLHTEYDPDVGWINKPNMYIKDMYGEGVYLQTNSQLFRNNYDFSLQVPPGKVRIICSGDSFTLGFGVDNDHTWCQQLVSLDNRLETVNMGQGGYGIDQAYLWYKRDGVKLEHHIHLFVFITDNFRRMQHATFFGYGKPVLALQEGALVVQNVPVPKAHPFYRPRLMYNLIAFTNNLRALRLWREIFSQKDPGLSVNTYSQTDQETYKIVSKIFQDLQQTNRAKQSTLVFVYLPMEIDYFRDTQELMQWRSSIHQEASANNLFLIDLIDELRKLPPQETRKLFIPEGTMKYVDSAGHYTNEGNAYVASMIYQQLRAIPEIAELFQQK